MDFKQFRDTGELSDITIEVNGKDFKLHKFPLYIRSDYFKTLAGSNDSGEKEIVELDAFPGGQEIFELVADFCYNIKVHITKENVTELRCAAEYLQMKSPGNLADIADKYLIEVLTTAKLSRSLGTVGEFLLKCCKLGAISEQAAVVSKCTEAIVEAWLKPSSKFTAPPKSQENDNMERIMLLPLDWFTKLLISARERKVNLKVIFDAVQRYITRALIRRKPTLTTETEEVEISSDVSTKDKTNTDENDIIQEPADSTSGDVSSTQSNPEEQYYDGGHPPEKGEIEPGEKENEQEVFNCDDIENWDEETRKEVSKVIDTLLLEMPEDAPFTEVVSASWVADTLKAADALSCKSRELLVKIASKILQRFTMSELTRLKAEILCEIIQFACSEPSNLPEVVCGVVDNYLLELAQHEKLSVNDFKQIVNAVPPDYRPIHDALFQVLEIILQSDMDEINEDQRKDLFDIIDFKRLGEETLERAYDDNLIPSTYVTKAALALCKKLRVELENARAVIRMQEEELSQMSYSSKHSSSSWMNTHTSRYPEIRPSKYSSKRISYNQGKSPGSSSSSRSPMSHMRSPIRSPHSSSQVVDILDRSPPRIASGPVDSSSLFHTPFKSYLDDGDGHLDNSYESDRLVSIYRKYSSRSLYQ